MALEQYKTQVLLLHSEQSTLDTLSTGFNDRYSVHLATSGIEALNVFTESPVDVIVSAQDLPGMSGLDALREAKKRSPDIIGILLAGTDQDDGLEALVGDQEVFQIVRGEVTPKSLKALVDSATQRARILAMSVSANDSAANVDHPASEHIVMETSENGSTIISDGTGQMPALQPNKISIAPDSGSRNVDILVLTKDDEFLATIKDSSRGLHNVHHAATPTQAEDIVKGNKIGVLVTDAAMVGSNIEVLTQRLRQSVPRLVAVVAGRRDDGELLMDLINRGHVYRFLLKPVSPGRARLAIEASIKHHLDADEKAFKPAPQKTKAAAPKKKPVAKAAPAPTPAKKVSREMANPAPMTVSREDSLLDEGLDLAFDDGNSFTETMTGIAITVAKKLADVAESINTRSEPAPVETKAKEKPQPKPRPRKQTEPAVDTTPPMISLTDTPDGLMQNPKMLGIAAAAVIVIAGLAWFTLGGEDTPPAGSIDESAEPPAIVGSDFVPTPSAPPVTESVEPENFLASARDARDAGQLISPPGDNAVELYVAAVHAAPGDSAVAAELDAVIEQVFAIAESAILAQELAEASTALQLLHFASPDNSRLPFLSAQLTQLQLRSTLDEARVAISEARFEDAENSIANAEILAGPDAAEVNAVATELNAARDNQQVDEVLAIANEKLEQNQLISPANDNARFYYQLALGNDPDNTAARQGLMIVASKLALQARVAIDSGQLTNAEDLLRNARALDPSSAELAVSALALDNAKAVKTQAAADALAANDRLAEQQRIAKQKRIEEEQRQADADKLAEQQRIEEQERLAEQQRQEDADRLAEQQRIADQEQIAEQQRQAEERRRAAAAAAAAATVASTSGGSATTVTGNANTSSANPPAENSQARDTTGGGTASVALNTSPTAATESAPVSKNTVTSTIEQPRESERVSVSSLTRINYVAPKYPRSARRRNITGSVDISFTVQNNGVVTDVSIIQSKPGTTFDKAAMDAVAQWRFEPPTENGVRVEKRTAVRLAFSLE